jgi:hypothetical protein
MSPLQCRPSTRQKTQSSDGPGEVEAGLDGQVALLLLGIVLLLQHVDVILRQLAPVWAKYGGLYESAQYLAGQRARAAPCRRDSRRRSW